MKTENGRWKMGVAFVAVGVTVAALAVLPTFKSFDTNDFSSNNYVLKINTNRFPTMGSTVDASNVIAHGYITSAAMPAYSGDVTSAVGTVTTSLRNGLSKTFSTLASTNGQSFAGGLVSTGAVRLLSTLDVAGPQTITNGLTVGGNLIVTGNVAFAGTGTGNGVGFTNVPGAALSNGVVVLASGTNRVVTTRTQTTNAILLGYFATNGVGTNVWYGNVSNGVGFTIFSAKPDDTNWVSWAIFKP